MAMLDTSTPHQRHTVSHQENEFDDMVVNVAFPLSYRKLVVEGHFHRDFEKSIRSKHIRRNVVEIFWPESLLNVTRRIWAQRCWNPNSCHSVSNTTHSAIKWISVTLSPCKTRSFESRMVNQIIQHIWLKRNKLGQALTIAPYRHWGFFKRCTGQS